MTGLLDGTVHLWDLKTGYAVQTLQGHTNSVTSVAFSKCSRYALTGSCDCTARLWDLHTGHTIKILKGHTNLVTLVALSTCGRYALTGSWDNTARLWDLNHWANLLSLEEVIQKIQTGKQFFTI